MSATRLYTIDDLSQIDDLNRYDLIRGELVCLAPAESRHGEVSAVLVGSLWKHVSERSLGKVYSSETGFILDQNPDTLLAPDAAFVLSNRLPPKEERESFLPIAPDLVVEVVSPSDRLTSLTDKVKAYLDAGVRLVWLVEPRRERITVYTQDHSYRMLTVEDELDGGDVLPEYRLPVAEVFD